MYIIPECCRNVIFRKHHWSIRWRVLEFGEVLQVQGLKEWSLASSPWCDHTEISLLTVSLRAEQNHLIDWTSEQVCVTKAPSWEWSRCQARCVSLEQRDPGRDTYKVSDPWQPLTSIELGFFLFPFSYHFFSITFLSLSPESINILGTGIPYRVMLGKIHFETKIGGLF